MSTTVRLALVPREGFFCKDGRGWFTSASSRGHALEWPWPQTILGALRTAFGRAQEAERGKAFQSQDWAGQTTTVQLGRSFALRRPLGADWAPEHRVWPVPADARWEEGATMVTRLDPKPSLVPTLGREDDPAREALWRPALQGRGKPLPSPTWWSEAEFAAWVTGKDVAAGTSPLRLARRIQTHVTIDPATFTAVSGLLYSHDVVETIERSAEWAIAAEAAFPGEPPRWVTLGADARLVAVEPLPPALFEPPASLLDAFRGGSPGLRLIVVTPASFRRGWLPNGLQRDGTLYRGQLRGLEPEVVLRAAIVPRPFEVSGWAVREGVAKRSERLAPPGAVYFFERADGKPFGEAEARALWLAPLGSRSSEGYGRVIPAVWTPERSN